MLLRHLVLASDPESLAVLEVRHQAIALLRHGTFSNLWREAVGCFDLAPFLNSAVDLCQFGSGLLVWQQISLAGLVRDDEQPPSPVCDQWHR